MDSSVHPAHSPGKFPGPPDRPRKRGRLRGLAAILFRKRITNLPVLVRVRVPRRECSRADRCSP
jgi:hypothetical protein